MFEELISSRPERERLSRRAVAVVASLVVHGAALGALLLVLLEEAKRPQPEPQAVTFLEIPPLEPPGSPPSEEAEPAPAPSSEPDERTAEPPDRGPDWEVAERFTEVSEEAEAPGGFRELPAPLERAGIPPPDPSAEEVDPRDYGGRGLVGYDAPSFVYAYYTRALQEAIRRHWRPPLRSPRLELVLSFRILRDGTVTELVVLSSSGHAGFDRAGLAAVEAASPLPPLPLGFRPPSLGVQLVMR